MLITQYSANRNELVTDNKQPRSRYNDKRLPSVTAAFLFSARNQDRKIDSFQKLVIDQPLYGFVLSREELGAKTWLTEPLWRKLVSYYWGSFSMARYDS